IPPGSGEGPPMPRESHTVVCPTGTAALPESSATPRGYTTADLARRYRVGEDKVRAWINRGELRAVNTAAALCGKPRWAVTADALAEFERRRQGGPPPKPTRRKRQPALVDYFPD